MSNRHDNDDVQRVLAETPRGLTVQLKVVPGASRTQVAGVLGDRIRVAVAAAPQAGRANRAVCQLLADVFGVHRCHVVVVSGMTRPLKTVVVEGVKMPDAVSRLRRALGTATTGET